MKRETLWVDGVPPETKQALQKSAMQLYGKANASLLVRQLIAQHLSNSKQQQQLLTPEQAADTVRCEIRLPRVAMEQLATMSDSRLSKSRNYYIVSIILSYLGKPQLQGDEIEVLRRSNYEISKIGTNLNQISKAFNTIVKTGGGKVPEIGKKVAALSRNISNHTNLVLRVLNAGTTIWEYTGKGNNRKKRK